MVGQWSRSQRCRLRMKNSCATFLTRVFLRNRCVPILVAALAASYLSLRYYIATDITRQQQSIKTASPTSTQNRKNASVEIIRLNHDFGRVSPGATLNHTFRITNNTDTKWTIKKLATTCSCTIARPQSNVLLPHSAQALEVTYKSPSDCADDKRFVTVQFHEDHSPIYELGIAAQVRRPLSIQKRNLHFTGLAIRGAKTQELQIENYSGEKWNRLNVEHDQAWLSSTAKCIGTPNGIQTWCVSVTASAENLSAGNHAAILRISTTTPSQRFASDIPIVATVVNDVAVAPSMLFFVELSPVPRYHEQL